MILWTLSALLVAETRYLRGQPLAVEIFIEVALVVVVRKLITLPVETISPPMSEMAMWTGSTVALAVAYAIVKWVSGVAAKNKGAEVSRNPEGLE